MKANHLDHTDPRWSASTPLAAAVISLLLFGVFVVFWAEQRLVSGEIPLQGMLVLHSGQAADTTQGLSVRAELDPWTSQQVVEGQEAILHLRSASDAPPLDLEAEVIGITRKDRGTTIFLQPRSGELPKVEGLALLNGSPVAVSLLTGERSVLRLLLAPVAGVISRSKSDQAPDNT